MHSFSATVAEFIACQEAFSHTAYSGLETTVRCNYPGSQLNPTVHLCRDSTNSSSSSRGCEESSRTSAARRRMASLDVVLAQVSPPDQGLYWCAFRRDGYRAAYKKIQLSVTGEDGPQGERIVFT